MEEKVWYEISANNAEELRRMVAGRRNKTEKALELLSASAVDYVSNYGEYVRLDDELYCKDLLNNNFPYSMGNIMGKGKVGQVALLTRDNIKLIIKSMSAKDVKYLSLRIMDYIGDNMNIGGDYWRITDMNNNRKILAVGGDNFSNQTSLHLILNLILGRNQLYIHQYDAFYCDGKGYNVIEYCNEGDLHGFLEENIITDGILFSLLTHILGALAPLKHPKYNFNHSDLKAKNVFVNKTEQGFIFKIADYDKSSITWNGFRFYNWSQNYGTASPIKIERNEDGKYMYILSSMLPLQLYTMHNPYGIPGTFDIYTLILSLFASKNVWNKYINGELPKFKELVHRLFEGSSYYVVLGKVAQNHEAVISMSHINSILNGVPLQYDLTYMYEMLGVTPPPIFTQETQYLKINTSSGNHLCIDSCDINGDRNDRYKTCTTNTYSKTGYSGYSTQYNWDYC